jgi:hypothetical protein
VIFMSSVLIAWVMCWRSRVRRWRCASALNSADDYEATGRLIEPIRPEALIEVRRAFAEPIGAAQTVARYIGELARQLCDTLERRGLGARRLDLICQRVDSRAQAVRVGTGLPLRDAKRITRLLCDKIETIDPGFGIEVMTLAATVTEPLPPKQASSSLIDQPEPDVSGLIDLLANRVGEKNLYRAAPVASDVPERTAPHSCALARDRRGMAWALATAVAAAHPARSDRHRGAVAGSPTGFLHLARRAPAGEAGRWPRARIWRMVEAGPRAREGARLFPPRGRCGRALLGLPRR